jgi:hypothetical protein
MIGCCATQMMLIAISPGRHVVKAAALHGVLCSIPRNNPVWEAIRALGGAH